jgi:uncharacterized phiE125 gp8 family phage protein
MGLKQTVAPAIEPIDRDDVKQHLRIGGGDEDNYLDGLITAARQFVEERTGRQLITATWKETRYRFPECEWTLDRPDLIGVSSLTYKLASDGTVTTLASTDYTVSTNGHRGVVVPAFGTSWPGARYEIDAVALTYTSGFGATAASVPQAIKQAMLLLIGSWYENREAVMVGTISKEVEFAVEALLAPYMVGNYR